MKTRIDSICKSALVVSALLVSATVHAGNDPCFEDGLKNPVAPPAPSIHVDHHGGHGWGSVKHDWHTNPQHHSWKDWSNHGSGSGNGGIGVSPIPEPQTEAMLLTGLLMLGALVRRKAKARG